VARQAFATLQHSNRRWPHPRDPFGGEFLHPSIPAMAAAYLFHLCQNHPFIDGNKRVGANAAITFLLLNDWDLEFTPEELVDVVLDLASGKLGKPELIARSWGASDLPRTPV
jgi:death-on-curing protein